MSGKEFEKLWKTEDWWSVWLGLGIVFLAIFTFWAGGSIKGWVVIPAKLTEFSKVWADLAKNVTGYLASSFSSSVRYSAYPWPSWVTN